MLKTEMNNNFNNILENKLTDLDKKIFFINNKNNISTNKKLKEMSNNINLQFTESKLNIEELQYVKDKINDTEAKFTQQ